MIKPDSEGGANLDPKPRDKGPGRREGCSVRTPDFLSRPRPRKPQSPPSSCPCQVPVVLTGGCVTDTSPISPSRRELWEGGAPSLDAMEGSSNTCELLPEFGFGGKQLSARSAPMSDLKLEGV